MMNLTPYEMIEMAIDLAGLIVALVGLYLEIKGQSDDDINNKK